MTDIAGDWVGKMLGTNNADIFVEIVQSQRDLTGTVRVNDPKYGSAVHDYKGILQGHLLNLEIDPPHIVNGVVQTKGDSLDRGSAIGTLVDTKRIRENHNVNRGRLTYLGIFLTLHSKLVRAIKKAR